jgi:hypothetical protein
MRLFVIIIVLCLFVPFAGCKKKEAPAPAAKQATPTTPAVQSNISSSVSSHRDLEKHNIHVKSIEIRKLQGKYAFARTRRVEAKPERRPAAVEPPMPEPVAAVPVLAVPVEAMPVPAEPPSMPAAEALVPAPQPAATGSIESQLSWNIWVEDGPRYKPVTSDRLMPNHNYAVAVDLSALKYRLFSPDGTMVESPAVSPSFLKQVEKWLQPGMPPPKLQILFLPDQEKFANVPIVRDFTVNMGHLKKVFKQGKKIDSKDPFADLSVAYEDGAESPDFSFGEVYFGVTTTASEGPTSIAFSIWDDSRPLNEFTLETCIASSDEVAKQKCKGRRQAITNQGLSVSAMPSETGTSPIAALHIVGLSNQDGYAPVKGVFRARKWPRDQFVVWQYDHNMSDFQKYLDLYIKNIENGEDEKNLLQRGKVLFDFLFPRDRESIDGKKIQEEVKAIIRPALTENPSAADYLPPSLFIRMINVSGSASSPIPLSLLALPIDETKEISKSNGKFLGDYFVIETPLDVQTYDLTGEKCPSNWVTVLPPEGTGEAAIDKANAELDKLLPYAKQPISTMTAFSNWLARDGNAPPTVLITLSHHDNNSLYFYDKTSPLDNPLLPVSIQKHFDNPSIAVLDGCGTGSSAALGLIQRLNRHGFYTIIATSTEIEGPMAGSFLSALAEGIKSDSSPPDSIRSIYWHAVQKIRSKYGPKALRFSLLGNPNAPVCAPLTFNQPLLP